MDEAVAASLVKLVARQLMQKGMLRASGRRAVEKAAQAGRAPTQAVRAAAQAGRAAAPQTPVRPRIIRIERPITGFRTSRGTQYTWNSKTGTTSSVTAPGHHLSPPGPKPETSYTVFSPRRYAGPMRNQWETGKDWATGKPLTGDWKHVQGHTNLYSNKPELGTHPLERWRNYPAGVEYRQGTVSKGGESMLHMGSEIDKIYRRTIPGQLRLRLSPENKLDLRRRVKTALSKPQNREVLRREIESSRRFPRPTSQMPNQ